MCAIVAVLTTTGCGRIGFGPSGDDTSDGAIDTMGSTSSRISLVQSTNGWSPSRVTSRSVSLGAAPTPGNLVIVAVSTSFTAPVTVTDNAGNTYQGISSNPAMNSPTYCNVHMFYASDVMTVDGFTATVTTGPGDDWLSVVVLEVAGADPIIPLAADTKGAATSTSPMVGPIQSSRDGALYFAVLCHNATRTTTMGPGYELLEVPTEAGATNSAMVTAYKLGNAAPTTADAMLSPADSWQMMLAAFE